MKGDTVGWSGTLSPDLDAVARGAVRESESASLDVLASFVEKHRERVYRVAAHMVGAHEDADDVVQEAFLRAYRSLGRFRGDAAVETWLYRIVANVAVNHLRQRSRRRRFVGRLMRRPAAVARASESPAAQAEAVEVRAIVRDALDELSPDHRAVVVLFDLEGLTCAETARVLGVPEGTVRSRLHHARGRLRRRLEPYVREGSRKGRA
jgi:RNA polymerase sigma-70 factor (ECF subfamily)